VQVWGSQWSINGRYRVWKICERMAEVQALLDDHVAGGKHSAAAVVATAVRRSRARFLRGFFLAATVGCDAPSSGGVFRGK
jgi:hypothetical protein